jgi:hypothetical protein
MAQEMLKLEQRLAARETRWQTSLVGRFSGALHLRNFLLRLRGIPAIAGLFLRNLRLGRMFKGRGVTKLLHAIAYPFDLAFARKSIRARHRHLSVDRVLPIITLPLEDDSIIETERLRRCPSVHVYYDPRTGGVNYVPICSWRLYNKKILGELAAHYAAQRGALEGEAAEAAQPLASA